MDNSHYETFYQEKPFLRHNTGIFIRPGELSRQDVQVVLEVLVHDTYKLATLQGTQAQGELAIDIGAHIGTFAVKWRTLNPFADIVCVEVNTDNIPCLRANVGGWGDVIHAACTYEKDIILYNSIKAGGTATGGSYVAATVADYNQRIFFRDERPLRTVTLDEILEARGKEKIEILKLDCEGSEFSILDNFTRMECVHYVVGEYHGRQRWEELRRKVFTAPRWKYQHVRGGEIGIFIAENKQW